ncbi:MAG: hypothetical protein NVSMB13_14790 [Mycobacteriales bacterium]
MTLLGEVEQPPRRADDDVDALAQRLYLWLVGATAVDRQGADRLVASCRRDVLSHLHAQLAGRYDDQRLGLATARQVDPLEQRDAEGEGLAGAGPGLADQVGAGKRDRQGQRLDREGRGDADLVEGGDDLGGYTEVSEAGYLCGRQGRLGDDFGNEAGDRVDVGVVKVDVVEVNLGIGLGLGLGLGVQDSAFLGTRRRRRVLSTARDGHPQQVLGADCAVAGAPVATSTHNDR